jgi:hypothetical protein
MRDLPGLIRHPEAMAKASENTIKRQILYTGFGRPGCVKGMFHD